MWVTTRRRSGTLPRANAARRRVYLVHFFRMLQVPNNADAVSLSVSNGEWIVPLVIRAALTEDRVDRRREAEALIDRELAPLNGAEIVDVPPFARKAGHRRNGDAAPAAARAEDRDAGGSEDRRVRP